MTRKRKSGGALDRAARAVERVSDYAREMSLRADGWANSVRGIGTAADPASSSTFMRSQPLPWETAEALYYGDDVMQRIADVPAQEITRRDFEIVVEKSDGLAKGADIARATMAALEDMDALGKIREALTWAAVNGGALIMPGVDDRSDGEAARALAMPLNEKSIKSFRWLTVFQPYELRVVEYQLDAAKPRYGEPLMYEVWYARQGSSLPIGTKIHASRLWRFDAMLSTWNERQRRQGWGPSTYETVVDIVRDFGMTYKSLGALVQNASQAVMRLGHLADTLAEDGGDELVRQRIRLMDLTRSVMRSVVLDASENEGFEYHTATLTGYAEAIDKMSARVAAAARMPQSLLFGQAPAGLQATGASDVRFFYDAIDARRRRELRPCLEWIVRLLLSSQRGPTNGNVPRDWRITFPSLWQPTDDEMADIYAKTAQADGVYIAQGGLDAKEVAEARWATGIFSTSLQLPERMIEPEQAAVVAGAEGEDRQRAALNGAQVTAVVEVVKSAARGELQRESAVNILLAGFPLTGEQAEAVVGESGRGFKLRETTDEDDEADSFVPTREMAEAADRGLALRQEYGRGGTPVGIARARDISNRAQLSLDTVRRMRAFFDRHASNRDTPPDEGNGQIAWLLWGGDAGRAWAERILGNMDAER